MGKNEKDTLNIGFKISVILNIVFVFIIISLIGKTNNLNNNKTDKSTTIQTTNELIDVVGKYTTKDSQFYITFNKNGTCETNLLETDKCEYKVISSEQITINMYKYYVSVNGSIDPQDDKYYTSQKDCENDLQKYQDKNPNAKVMCYSRDTGVLTQTAGDLSNEFYLDNSFETTKNVYQNTYKLYFVKQ